MAPQRSRVSALLTLELVGSMTLFSFGMKRSRAIRSNGLLMGIDSRGVSLSVRRDFFEISQMDGNACEASGLDARSACDSKPIDRLPTSDTMHN